MNNPEKIKILYESLLELDLKKLSEFLRKKLQSTPEDRSVLQRFYYIISNPRIVSAIHQEDFESFSSIVKRFIKSEDDLDKILMFIKKVKNELPSVKKPAEGVVENPVFLFNMHAKRYLDKGELETILTMCGISASKVFDLIMNTYDEYLNYLRTFNFDKAKEILESWKREIALKSGVIVLKLLLDYLILIYEVSSLEHIEGVSEAADELYKIFYEIVPETLTVTEEFKLKSKRVLAVHYYLVGELRKSETILSELELIENSVDALAVIYNLRLHVYYDLGKKTKLEEYVKKLENIIEKIASPYIKVAMYNSLGNFNNYLGNIEKSVLYYEEGLELAKKYKLEEFIDTITHNIGVIKFLQGHYEESLRIFNEVIKMREEAGNILTLYHALNNILSIYLETNDCNKAKDVIGKLEKVKEKISDYTIVTNYITNLAAYYIRCERNPERGLEILNNLLKEYKIIREVKGPSKIGVFLILSEAYLEMKDLDRALNYASIAHSYAHLSGDLWSVFTASCTLGKIYAEKASQGDIVAIESLKLIYPEIADLKEKLKIVRSKAYDEFIENIKKHGLESILKEETTRFM